MKVVTGNKMKEIDRQSIEEIGISGVVLMEHAGMKVTETIIGFLDDLTEAKVIVLAGKGNNGGDGFVVARLLENKGIEVKTILLGTKDQISGDAKINLEILEKLDYMVEEVTTKEEVKSLVEELEEANVIVDALLGTGIKGKLRGLYPDLIRLVNHVSTSVIAVDIPSGVEAATGNIESVAIKATETITFGLPKIGLILYPGADYIGRLKVVDIGLPQKVIDNQQLNIDLITFDLIKELLPGRVAKSHKGSYGKLLLIAGSPGMTGAATLAAQASLRIGTGLVTVGVPESLNLILETKLTEAMTYPLSETEEGVLSKAALDEIKKLLEKRELLAIGPGLTVTEDIKYILNQLIVKIEKPLIIDADGLNAINDLDSLKKRKTPTVLTPHLGEMARLIGKSIQEIKENKLKIAKNFAQEYGVILVLKGVRTIIANPQGQIYINITGNSGLATGGSGDVLTGLIAGLAVQIESVLSATLIAVYLHGLAGDLAARELTEYSLLPSDLFNYLPQAIKKVRSK